MLNLSNRTTIIIMLGSMALMFYLFYGLYQNNNVGVGDISDNLKLKADKDLIVNSEVKKKMVCTSTRASTTKDGFAFEECTNFIYEDYQEYSYISDEVATVTPYYNGNNATNAEYLDSNKKLIAFHADTKWAKGADGKDYVVKKATTTVDAFKELTSPKLEENLLNFFFSPAIATTSYTSTTTYTPECAGNVNVLIVGGGGGGASFGGGGGGAGGYTSSTSYAVTVTSYNVVVGWGGSGKANGAGAGDNGGTSTFGILSSHGGGGGSNGDDGKNGKNGGSGGGAGCRGYTGGYGIAGQGNNGGNSNATYYNGGGGGGASAAGANAITDCKGGNGGDGTANLITGSSVTYGGGGGGAGQSACGGTGGLGGSGGGGAGAVDANNATSGTNDRGGGGGGGYTGNGGNGGTGIVIVGFLGTCPPAGGGTSSDNGTTIIFD